MFKKNFVRLCNEIKKPPTTVCIELGLNKATFSNWKEDSVPHARTLEKIADYFGVSVEDLLKDEEKHKIEIEGSILTIFSQLSEEKQKEALSYLRFLAEKRDN